MLCDIFRSRIRYSPESFVTTHARLKGWWHGRHVAHGSVGSVNGNRNVPYLNRWNDERNLNLNWHDNDWNGDYRFLAVRHSRRFSRFILKREFC